MYNFATATFPDSAVDPIYVYSVTLRQRQYEHEVLTIKFKDWDISYDNVKAGSPIQVELMGADSKRKFYGYINHIEAEQTPGKNFTTVVCVGGTFPLKQSTQEVYRAITANQVIEQIAEKHGLTAIAQPHPRVYDQISHAGQSDWQMCVKLAKQCGYSLRAENTELYFQPILTDYADYRKTAHTFIKRNVADPNGSTLYSFKPIIGESLSWNGDMKSAVAVSGVDKNNKAPLKTVQQKRNKKTRGKSELEFFDTFADVVAPTAEIAEFEAAAAENRNSFPYRATAQVIGNTELRPDAPVYLTGIGKDHTGFWTILGVDHEIIEEQTKVYKYVSTLYLGTDSLGLATGWTDAETITAPTSNKQRVIKANKKQTIVKPKTSIYKKGLKISPQTKGTFGKINNRAKPAAVANITSTWKSKSKALKVNSTPVAKTKSKTVVARLAKAKKI